MGDFTSEAFNECASASVRLAGRLTNERKALAWKTQRLIVRTDKAIERQ